MDYLSTLYLTLTTTIIHSFFLILVQIILIRGNCVECVDVCSEYEMTLPDALQGCGHKYTTCRHRPLIRVANTRHDKTMQ